MLLLSANGFTQNLVPNGDFESLVNLPIKPNPKNSFQYEPLSGYKPFLFNVNSWIGATKSTPDLRITDVNKHRLCKKKFVDCNRSKSGIICGGIITHQSNKTFQTYREYLEVKLTEKLQIGKTINIEFWVRKEREAKLVTNNLGCFLSEEKVYNEIENQLKKDPHYNHTEVINQGETKWTKISTTLKVDKAYEYLIIGNFFNNESTIIEDYENYIGNAYIPPYAYYLIDDVKLWYEGTEPFSQAIAKAPKPVKKIIAEKVYVEDVIVENAFIDFEYNQANLTNNSIPILDQIIKKLENSQAQYTIQVIGHTDDIGSASFNLDLSKRRAQSVVDYFIRIGFQHGKITSKGMGAIQPIAKNDTEEGRKRNRRVEIKLNKVSD